MDEKGREAALRWYRENEPRCDGPPLFMRTFGVDQATGLPRDIVEEGPKEVDRDMATWRHHEATSTYLDRTDSSTPHNTARVEVFEADNHDVPPKWGKVIRVTVNRAAGHPEDKKVVPWARNVDGGVEIHLGTSVCAENVEAAFRLLFANTAAPLHTGEAMVNDELRQYEEEKVPLKKRRILGKSVGRKLEFSSYLPNGRRVSPRESDHRRR